MKIPLRLASDPLPSPPGPVVLATGFRIFFLTGAAFGALSVPLWLILLAGGVSPPSALPPAWWHAHEMIIGYGGAVLAGFLLTAVRMWTGGRATAANGALLLLALGWLAGRIVHLPGIPDLGPATALPDVAWLLGLTVAIGRPLLQAGSRRNYGFLVALPVLAAISAALHLARTTRPDLGSTLLDLGVIVIVAVLAVVGGRIVPLFTRNALPALGVGAVPTAERLLPPALGCALAAPLVGPGWTQAALLSVAGVVLAARMARWRSLGTRDEPLLWILHLGCWWLPVGLFAKAAGAVSLIPTAVGLHALGAGAIGSLTLGMLARVSLGHTGRRLAAGRIVTAAFLAMIGAGVVRAVAPLAGTPPWMLHAAGALWSLALLLWLIRFVPILLTARPDGQPG